MKMEISHYIFKTERPWIQRQLKYDFSIISCNINPVPKGIFPKLRKFHKLAILFGTSIHLLPMHAHGFQILEAQKPTSVGTYEEALFIAKKRNKPKKPPPRYLPLCPSPRCRGGQ